MRPKRLAVTMDSPYPASVSLDAGKTIRCKVCNLLPVAKPFSRQKELKGLKALERIGFRQQTIFGIKYAVLARLY